MSNGGHESKAVPSAAGTDREELLRRRLAGRRTGGRRSVIPKADRSAPLPLAAGQQQMWFLSRLDPDSTEYLIPLVVRLRGALDDSALERALGEISARHEVLRTRYAMTPDGQPVQIVDAPAESTAVLTVEQVPGGTPAERERRLTALVAAETAAPFDLETDWPLRARVFRLTENDHVLCLVFHHIACDAWSTRILLTEISALYGAFTAGRPSPLEPLPVQYADYAAWQREQLSGNGLQRQLAHWRTTLDGVAPTELPTDRPRPATRSYAGAEVLFDFPAELPQAVRELAAAQETTPFTVMMAAFQAVIARSTGQSDISVGTVVSGRARPELQSLIGYGINSLVLRGHWDEDTDPAFTDLLDRTRRTVLDAFDHQDVPFAQLVDELQPERDLSRTPLYQIAFTMHESRLDAVDLPGLRVEPYSGGAPVAKCDLTLQVEESTDGSFHGRVEYASALFDRETAQRTARHFLQLLQSAVAAPSTPISRLSMLDPAEHAIVSGSLDGHLPSAAVERCVHEIFAERAAAAPDAVAVIAGDVELTYAELDARANRLAHHLRSLGVGPESLVGVCLERGPDLMPTLLAVLKAGAGYLPLDPANPAERLGFVLADAGARVVVTSGELVTVLDEVFDGELVVLDRDAEAIASRPRTAPETSVAPDNIVYVIYTSGSTGRPKGVTLAHTQVVRLLETAQEHYGFDEGDVWTLFHSYAFDVSVFEMWGALFHGGTLVVVPREVTRSPEDFLDLLVQHKVTVLSQTPTAFRSLVAAAGQDDPRIRQLALCAVIFAGEKLEVGELRPWTDRLGLDAPHLVNMYGITETTVHTTYYRISDEDFDPAAVNRVGYPLSDLRVYLLDRFGELVPVGVPGEIYVGGPGVARGYLNRPELTAERFVPDPFGPAGSRLYRSGDLARRRADGSLEFLGRADDQVKVRGYRIEPGEISARLSAHPAIRDAVVIVRDERLVAYLVVESELPSTAELRAFVAGTLPEYMVPAAFVELGRIPLTVNGKLDRRALPEPGGSAFAEAAFVAPRTPTEQRVAEVWQEVLGVERVGVEDGFFELGGDSIRAVALVGALRAAGFDVAVRDVFEHRTVASLTELITGRPAVTDADRRIEPFALISDEDRAKLPEGVVDAYPLSQVQLGMVVEMLVDDSRNNYHNVSTFRVLDDKPFSLDALQAAGRLVVERHEALRTSIELNAYSVPLQLVHATAELPLGRQDLRGLDAETVERELRDFTVRERATLFDLGTPSLMRFFAHVTDGDCWWISVTECHPVLEGWSHHSLLMELLALYRQLRDGLEPEPYEAPAVRFADFVAGELESLASTEDRAYWRDVVDRHAPFSLPTGWGEQQDGPRELYQAWTQWEDLERDLRKLATDSKVSLKSVMLAAHLKVMSQLTGEDAFHTGVVCDARPEVLGADRVLGMYLNTLPFAVDRSARTWRELVQQVFAREVELWPHRRFPMPEIQRDAADGRRLLDVMFNYQDFRQMDATVVDDRAGLDDSPTEFPLTVSSRAGHVIITADPRMLSRANGERLVGMYRAVLESMAADPDGDAQAAYLPADERDMLLSAAGPVVASAPVERCVHEIFQERAAATPDSVAVVFGESSLTYAEVDARANRLAHHLRSSGVTEGSLVGVCLERGLDLVPSLLGVLKAGAGYLPLDPASPADRLGYVLTDAGARVTVTSHTLVPVLGEVFDGELVVLDRDTETIASHPHTPPVVSVDPGSVVYVIYTSGSTGRPKGVVLAHANVVRLFETAQAQFGFGPSDVWTLFHSYAFDFSVWEIFGALLHGGRLVVVPEMTAREPSRFHELLVREGVTVLNQTPSAFTQLIEEDRTNGDSGRLALRTVVFGGEALDYRPLRNWVERHALESTRLVNMYGITETTVHVTYHPVGEEDLATGGSASPIGHPLNDLSLHLLDTRGELVPVGVPGEIYVGGPGVARGYLNRPELTAERFVPDPFGPAGSRLYRSGDLARRRADGSLEFLGRADDQVKVRGYRIEPGEISARLSEHPAVREAVVVVRHERLVAYLVVESELPSTAELRAFVGKTLPEYMVPAAFVVLERLPLTVNGKLDGRALPAPEFTSGAGREPRPGAEQVLCSLFAEVLGLDEVGVEDSFFDCGGDSILAIQLVSRARRAGWVLSARDVFQHPSVERLARAAVPLGADGAKAEPAGAGLGTVPLTPVMGWLRGLGGPVKGFHQHVVVSLPDAVNRTGLVRALQAVVDRHDMLRSRLVRTGGAWSLEVAAPGEVDADGLLEQVTVPDLDEAAVLTAIDERAEAERRRLDPDAGVVFRAVWCEPGRLLLVAHHLVVDGVSWRILLEDLKAAWEGRELEPVPSSFRSWARRLHEQADQGTYAAQLDVWRHIAGEPAQPLGSRALDAAKDTVVTRRVLALSLPAQLTEALLTRVPALFHGGVNDVLLAGLAPAVQEWRRRRDRDADGGVLLDLEGHGRVEEPGVDLSRTVGWFTSIHPVCLDAGGESWDELCAGGAAAGRVLKRVKEQMRAVPDDGIGYGVLRHLDPAAGAELATCGQAELAFNYLGRFTNGGDGAWELSARAGMVGGGADAGLPLAHALELNAVTYDLVEGPCLHAGWAWADGVLSEAEVRELAQLWFEALEGLARHADAPGSGGLTPSDLDLVQLSQDEIDVLEDGAAEVEDILPLQSLQEGLLFHSLVADGSVDVYTSQLRFDVAGEVDGAALRRAGERLLARHANLRAGFRHEGVSRPVQVVYRRVRLPWAEVDLSGAADTEGRAAELASQDRLRPFDLGRPPLLRLSLLKLDERRYRILLTGHHILWDGWSVPVLVEELFRLYAAGGDDAGLPPVTPYRDYLAWLARQDRPAAEQAWATALEGLPEPTLVAPDTTHDHSPVQDMVRTEMPKELAEALAATGRRHGVTLNTVIQGVWGLLLARQTGREDVVFGATVSGRPPELEGVERMLGLFINTLPVRVRLRPEEPVIGLLTRLQQEQAQLIPHHHYGLSDIQRTTGFGTLFDTTTVLTNYPLDPSVLDRVLGDLDVLDIDNEDATHYPLRMAVVPDGDSHGLRLGYLPDLYRRDEAQRLLDRVLHLLETLAEDPEQPVGGIDILTEEERHQLLVEWGGY